MSSQTSSLRDDPLGTVGARSRGCGCRLRAGGRSQGAHAGIPVRVRDRRARCRPSDGNGRVVPTSTVGCAPHDRLRPIGSGAAATVPGDQVAGGVEVVRGLAARGSRHPGSARLTSPTSVPAGGSSSTAVTPSSAIVAITRSQRTGRADLAHQPVQRRRGRPCTTSPSALDSSGSPGRDADRRPPRRCAERRRPGPCARCGTRRRPAADARAPGQAGRRRTPRARPPCPATTIWPAPFSLAAVRPCRCAVATTSSRSPPSTAVMPVAVIAAAAAIAAPRSRTKHHRLLGAEARPRPRPR